MSARPARKTFVRLLDAEARALLTDSDLRTYYASVSAYEDVTFWLVSNARLLDQERAELHELRRLVGVNGGKHTPATRQSFARLKSEHWSRRMAEDRAAGTLELGSCGPSLTEHALVLKIDCDCQACAKRRLAHRPPLHRIRKEGYAEVIVTLAEQE